MICRPTTFCKESGLRVPLLELRLDSTENLNFQLEGPTKTLWVVGKGVSCRPATSAGVAPKEFLNRFSKFPVAC